MSKDAGNQTTTQNQTSTTTAQLPAFLQPLIDQSVGGAQQGLTGLSNLVNNGFNAAQTAGQQSAIDIANGRGGFIPETQATLRDLMRGQFVNDNVGTTLSTVQDITQGGGAIADRGTVNSATGFLQNFAQDSNADRGAAEQLSRFALDPNADRGAINQLTALARQQGADLGAAQQLGNLAQDDTADRGAIDRLGGFSQATGADLGSAQQLNQFALDQNAGQGATDSLRGFTESQFDLNPVSRQALEQSASGDFLFGNPGFDEAVQASVRAARPNILSTFAGQGGSGAASGGLAQTAIQQAASDAFAGLFNQERARQQGAAGQLGQFDFQGRQQQIGAAQDLGQLGLQGRQQQIGAAQAGGQLGLQGQQQRIGATQAQGGLGLDRLRQSIAATQAQGGLGLQGQQQQIGASQAQGQLGLQNRGQQIGATQAVGDLGLRERQQQINAAQGLGQLGIAQQGQQLGEQQLRAGTALDFGGLLSTERGRQLDAAQLFPQSGLQRSQILRDVGREQQQVPLQLQQALLNASLSGLPLNSLIGNTTESEGQTSQPLTRNAGAGALGGALAGAQLGNVVPGLGTGVGAIGGGLLGAFF